MTRLALDTNAYTALGRGHKSLAAAVRRATQVGLPITVLGEIHFGLLNGSHQAANRAALERFLANSRVEILSIDETTARQFGEIATGLRRLGRPIQQNDIWIAALCKQYDYALATNDRGYENVLGLEVMGF